MRRAREETLQGQVEGPVRTAAAECGERLGQPWGRQGTDAFWPDPAAYSEAVRHLHRAGVRTATHAIGDAAVRHVLDTAESPVRLTVTGGHVVHREV